MLVALERPIERAKTTGFPCGGCTKSFNSSHALDNHLRSVHKSTYCYSCTSHFPDEQSRISHILDGSEDTTGKFRCGDCDDSQPNTVFPNEKDLIKHAWSKHKRCAPCQQIFKTQGSLLDHDHEVHHKCLGCLQVLLQ